MAMIQIGDFDDPTRPLAWQRIIRTRMAAILANTLLFGCVLAYAVRLVMHTKY